MQLAKTLALGCALTAPAVASAQTRDTSFGVLIGTDTAFDGDPSTFRLSLQGAGDLTTDDIARLGIVMPLTWMTTGEDTFGISTRHTVVEIPPSLRLSLFHDLPVRPYGDVGLGLAVATDEVDGWPFGETDRNVGWMSRAAIGVEIGSSDGFMVMVEPLSLRTYHIDGTDARLGGMVGVGTHF